MTDRLRRIVAAVIFVFTWTLTTHGKYSASGDEPHYLMVTDSLVRDHDVDVANNYRQNDGRAFGADGLQPGPHVRPARDGRLHSVHDVGLSVLLVPPYVMARLAARFPSERLLSRVRMSRGLFAYSIVSLCLLALTTWSLSYVADGLATIAGAEVAAAVMLMIAISPPVLSQSFLLFPEAPALWITALVVWFVTKTESDDDVSTLLWLAGLLGFLPWMHRKYTFYALGLLFVLLRQARTTVAVLSPRRRVALAALFVAPQIAFYLWTWHVWGTFAGPQLLDSLPFSVSGAPAGALGLWLDRQSGALAYAPMYWILPLCWALTWRSTWPFLIALLTLYLPMATFVDWPAGFSPPARYLAPVFPLCAVPLAAAVQRRAVKWFIAPLWLAQLAVDVMSWQHPRGLWPQASGGNAVLESLGSIGRAYERVLPSLRQDGLTVHAALLGLVLIGLVVLGAALEWRKEENGEVRPPRDATQS